LRRSDLPLETVELARFLLGTLLVRDSSEGRIAARIVETEAYLPSRDPASHAFKGPSPRNRAMFLRHGHAYVYLIYGTAHCLNVTSERAGVGAAVLIRAAEPLEGLALMARRRGTENARDLARGPGRLAQAFGLDRTHDALDICARGAEIWLAAGEPPMRIAKSARIGLTRAATRVLRFYVKDSPFVSGPVRLNR